MSEAPRTGDYLMKTPSASTASAAAPGRSRSGPLEIAGGDPGGGVSGRPGFLRRERLHPVHPGQSACDVRRDPDGDRQLRAHVFGVADLGRQARRHLRAQADVHVGRRGVHRGIDAVRAGAFAGFSDRGAGAPGHFRHHCCSRRCWRSCKSLSRKTKGRRRSDCSAR